MVFPTSSSTSADRVGGGPAEGKRQTQGMAGPPAEVSAV